MSEMVDRIAAALARGFDLPEWDRLDPDQREKFRWDAREALAALREPTDDMTSQFVGHQYGVYGDVEARAIWVRMIDAALKEA
jgi:acyl-CoA reductase-like NAD-dependent aldehyde dehydrogenase